MCIQRTTAEACRKSIESFDDLEAEARKVRVQRDEAQGARNELRMLYFDTLADAQDWQLKAKAAQEAADAAPSRLVWFGAGAAAGVVTTMVVFVLVR